MKTKKVTVRTEENEVFREFDSVGECAEFFETTKIAIYNRCTKPSHTYLARGMKLKFSVSKKREGEIMKKSTEPTESQLRKNETEDETRRRLGLNPYGEWRNDEWLFAMMDRVNKQLYPDGYDAHAAWLAMKGKERLERGNVRVAQEVMHEVYKDIDEEFLDYIK